MPATTVKMADIQTTPSMCSLNCAGRAATSTTPARISWTAKRGSTDRAPYDASFNRIENLSGTDGAPGY